MGTSIKVRSILVGVRKCPVCNQTGQFRERPVIIIRPVTVSKGQVRRVYECLSCNRLFDEMPKAEVPEEAKEPTVVRRSPSDRTEWPRVSTAPPREPTLPPDWASRIIKRGD